MPDFHFDMSAKLLGCGTTVHVILPDNPRQGTVRVQEFCRPDHKFKTLWLLHGGGDDYSCWVRKSSILRLAAKYGIAVVMPDAHNSFYLDQGSYRMWSFLNEELMPMMRFYFPLSDRREDNYVAGLSMGGMGTMRWALMCPEKFEAAAALSCGPFGIQYLIEHPDSPGAGRLTEPYREKIEAIRQDDVWQMAEKRLKENTVLPRFYIACGTEDATGACVHQREFEEFANKIGFPAQFVYDAGDHDWDFWNRYIEKALTFMMEEGRK